MGKCILHTNRQIGEIMNEIRIRKRLLTDYKAVIFDLDGTLYYQNPFRIRMLLFLAGYVLKRPSGIIDLLIIKRYRKVRENWEKCKSECRCPDDGALMGLEEQQYQYVADKMKVGYDRVKNAVAFFILEAPLKLLPPYRDEILADWIDILHDANRPVIVYSDYPVENKLEALGIRADACYTSSDPRIDCMKPDPKGLRVILEDIGCTASDVLMIGDRYEKDRLAAKKNNMDYIIVSSSRKERRKLELI